MRRNWIGGTFGWLWLLVVLLPLYFVLITSLKSISTYFGSNPVLPTLPLAIENVTAVLEADFTRYLLNSVLVAVGTVVPLVLMAFMASYSIVRGTRRVFGPVRSLFLLGLAIPVQATIVPIYLMIIRMHMYDSLVALMIPAIAFGLPLSILIISNSLRDVPKELFEAARMDGAGHFRSYFQITLPMIVPSLATTSIFTFIWSWGDFFGPLIYVRLPELFPASLALKGFLDAQSSSDYGSMFAMSVVSLLPLFLVFLFGQRFLIKGAATSGIK
jgi:raffinose/stachyose/melibiose transport system permease protein